MARHLSKLPGKLTAIVTVTAALAAAVLAAPAGTARAAGVQPAVAKNSRGVTIVAGVHDTAVNDCDDGGDGTSVTSAQLALAGASVNDPAFPSGVTTLRVTMPWDVADPDIVSGTSAANQAVDIERLQVTQDCLNAWLKAVFAHGKQPEIDFRGDQYYAEASGQVLMPSLAQYTAAMTAFRSQYVDCGSSCANGGQVKIIAPWNEPDNQGQSKVGSIYDLLFPDGHTHLAGSSCPGSPTPSNCGAVMAAQMWVTDYQLMVQGSDGGTACSSCIVPAGDFSAGDGFLSVSSAACSNECPYVYLYNNSVVASGLRPDKWAVHPYTDTKDYQNGTADSPTRLSSFAARLQKYGYGTKTYIWLNEVSVCDTPGPGTCASYQTGQTGYVQSKSAAMSYLVNDLPLTVGASGPQVGRIDYYCYNGGEKACNNDWALEDGGTATLNAAGQVYASWAAAS